MIIEKKVEPILHRQKCTSCGYYTVYQAVPSGDKAIDRCTHCGYEVMLEWHQDLKASIKNTEKLFRNMTEIFPELAELKNPGDHILLD